MHLEPIEFDFKLTGVKVAGNVEGITVWLLTFDGFYHYGKSMAMEDETIGYVVLLSEDTPD